jgi:hypothetical protein
MSFLALRQPNPRWALPNARLGRECVAQRAHPRVGGRCVGEIAQFHHLTAYDAAHGAPGIRLALPLITAHQRLARTLAAVPFNAR